MATQVGYLVETASGIKSRFSYFDSEIKLKDMYKKIGCSSLDVVRLPMEIDIWVDDEGLLKSGNIVLNYLIKTPENNDVDLQLAGNALFVSFDSDGNTVGLSGEQINWIQNNVRINPHGIIR